MPTFSVFAVAKTSRRRARGSTVPFRFVIDSIYSVCRRRESFSSRASKFAVEIYPNHLTDSFPATKRLARSKVKDESNMPSSVLSGRTENNFRADKGEHRMPVITVPITSPEQWHNLRKPNVGCSEVGALFGVHDYLTAYGLAARKLGRLPDTVDNDVLKRGRYLEPVARQVLAEQYQDWDQIAAGSYYYDPDIRFGATPDLFVKTDRGIGNVQIKTVEAGVFARKWHNADSHEVEPPLWVAMQAMGEQHLTGANFSVVAALVIGFGLSLEVIEVPYLAPVVESMRARVKAFWQMVDKGQLPAPDYEADGQNLARVLRQDDGQELDLSGDNELPDITAELATAQQAKSLAENSIKRCHARILDKLGTAERALFAHGGLITAKTVHRQAYVADIKATSYRPIRVRQPARAEV
jgi:hypothetical protein